MSSSLTCLASLRIATGLMLIGGAGCASQPELGQVSGTVSQDGRPLAGVLVSFLPDPRRGCSGRVSWSVTDQQGRYRLGYAEGSGGPGAVLGWHRVVVKDFAAENTRSRTAPVSLRVPARFTTAADTPLARQVRAGPQVMDLQIPPP